MSVHSDDVTLQQALYLLQAAANGEDVDLRRDEYRAVQDYIESGNEALAACQSQAAGCKRVLLALIEDLMGHLEEIHPHPSGEFLVSGAGWYEKKWIRHRDVLSVKVACILDTVKP